MRINTTELLVYLFISILFFTLVSGPAFFYPKPDLTPPPSNNPSQVTNTPSISYNPGNGSQSLGSFNFYILLFVLGIIALIVFIIQFGNYYTKTRNSRERKILEDSEKVSKLKFSRNEALKILENALITGNYTQGVIDAYLALDKALDNFREISRPKDWTPKEYAFTVREPIFRPSVFHIVDIFYYTRYAMKEANKEHITQFIFYLNRLFTNEVDEQEKDSEIKEFLKAKERWNLYAIPIRGDLTKPRGD